MSEEVLSFEEAIEKYDPVLGFEVHVELNTKTKMFDSAPNEFGDEPNTNVTPVSLGLPGALPMVNKTAVESAIKLGLALGCDIADKSYFARKNYFYPDSPKNFQTSQAGGPIAENGSLDVELEDGTIFTVEIERAHMEEDAGKLTHVGGADGRIQGATSSLVDYNRAGVPLIEIVTRPIVGAGERAPELARAYVAAIRDIVRSLGISDARMERGNVRCDANVSLMPKGAEKFGTRSETKNVNSLRSVERAVRYEIRRHAAILERGEEVTQETRHWHEDTRETSSGRPKSDADDYRYFPEPDLVPVVTNSEWIERLRAELPEPPAERRRRLKGEWGYSDEEFRDVVNAGALDVIEETVAAQPQQQPASGGWVKSPAAQSRLKLSSPPSAWSPQPWSPSKRSSPKARSTTRLPARCSNSSSPVKAPPPKSLRHAASPWSPTTVRSPQPFRRHWQQCPTLPTRSVPVRFRLLALSSVRS